MATLLYVGLIQSPDAPLDWQTSTVINEPQYLTFMWSTTDQNVSALWRVKVPGSQGPQQVASGAIKSVPKKPGQAGQFTIDFKTFAPASPANHPTVYDVTVSTYPATALANAPVSTSLPVKVTYQKSTQGPHQFQPKFDIDQFEKNLNLQLKAGAAVGYSYAIYKGLDLQKAGAGGLAVAPNVPQSADRRMTTMSMSKTITATAVMRAMEEMRDQGKVISIDSPIESYLPSDWKHGNHVKDMTFKHLLTHTSGLRPVCTDAEPEPDTYRNLRRTIQAGAQDADFGVASYANANFCLFRIIIPYMASTVTGQVPPLLNDDKNAEFTGKLYVVYVKERVLKPIGLGGIDVVPTGPKPYTRYYPVWDDTTQFYEDKTGDIPMLQTGAGYWHMSAKEFAKFIASLRSGLIVSPETFAIMQQQPTQLFLGTSIGGLGMYGVKSTYGWYYNHNGSLDGSVGDWMIFPNGITAVILVNSALWGNPPEVVVRTAFDNAWTAI
jgi:CubicO group peptidase (beta-lactamase class C family)